MHKQSETRTAAGTDDPNQTSLEPVAPGRVVDLAAMVLAFDAYMSILQGRKEKTSPLAQKGLLIIRRYADEMLGGINQHLVPLAERPDAGSLRDEFRVALKVGNATDVAHNQATLFRALLPWIKTRTAVLNGLFQGRVTLAARELATVVEETSPEGMINKLAAIAPVSGMSGHRKWIELAATEVGAPLKPVETVLVDAKVARDIGANIAKVESRIHAVHQGTPEAADLEAERLNLMDQLTRVAENSGNPSAVIAAAAVAKPLHQYATETGKRLGHTPDQEDAMMVRGRAIIAAGAGSGKTRVLASKVVFHIQEQGIDPASILASTFTTKAAAELVKRVRDYGAVIEGAALDSFGTTHSICGKFLNRRATSFRRASYIGKKEGWKQNTLIRLAMEQVKMLVPGAPNPPPARGIWEGAFVEEKKLTAPDGQAAPSSGGFDSKAMEFQQAVDDAIGYYKWAARTWSGGPGDWAMNQIPFLQDMRAKHPSTLTPRQRDWLNNLFTKVKGRNPISLRVAAEAETPKPKNTKSKLDGYTYYKSPAKQWFNLGRTLAREEKGVKIAIPLGEFKNAISIMKGKGLSPSEAWHGSGPYEAGSDMAAVYAAYEWLKSPKGETDFIGHGDMDDILVDTVTALVSSPTLRRQMQTQYKVLLLDEAQDLNRVQHLLFGLIAGYLDPATLEPKQDKTMTADTFALIGDDKQCVDVETLVSTPTGKTRAGDLKAGDKVLSFRNGLLVPQTVRHAQPSGWTWGFKVTTESGKSLTMSPVHKLWASEPILEDDQHLVYLMHRRDLGFRVGITGMGRDDSHQYAFGLRPVSEKAEKLWVLDICSDREEALTLEATYALRYQIPTMVYHTTNRKMSTGSDDRIQALFGEFGRNGGRLLEEKGLSPDYPHWIARTFVKDQKYTIQMVAHGPKGTQVALEVGPEVSLTVPFQATTRGTKSVRKFFTNYREALAFAHELKESTGFLLAEHISSPDGSLRKLTASALFPGMELMTEDASDISMDRIVSIEKVKGTFLDLDVEDASNFLGNQILTSNSIYEFRGADPEEFIDKSDLVPGGDDFKTKLLDTNFRSGQAIVDAANKLIARNKKQVPMTCKANVDRNGMGRIVSRVCTDTAEAAASVAEEIEGLMAAAQSSASKYKDFGVAVRSNAEAYQYGLEMLKKSIPFKSNAQFFNDTNTKALIGWLTIVEKGIDGPQEALEVAIRDSVRAPYSRLGQAFFSSLEEKAKGSWARWLVDGGWKSIYSRGDMAGVAEHFVNNLKAVVQMAGTPSEIVHQLMDLKGIDGNTMQEAMVRTVEENDDMMAELAAEAEGGVVTIEQIVELALAPVQPLLGLMSGRDNLSSAMTYIQKLKQVNDKKASKDTEEEIDRDAVTIGTMHSWKGLEVANMYVPMVGGKFPRTNKDGVANEGPDLWSQRRLAYVAITRAEQRCVILDIPNIKTGVHSQFIGEACMPTEEIKPTDGAVPKVAASDGWDDETIDELMLGDPDMDTALQDAWEAPTSEDQDFMKAWGF